MCAKSIIDQVADRRKADREEQEARDSFRARLDSWKKQGFVVTNLSRIIDDGDIADIETAFEKYEKDLQEVHILRTKLRALDIRTLESDFYAIDYKLQDPEKLGEARRDITNLKKKIERRDNRWARERQEAEALRKEHELKMAEQVRLNKELEMEKQEDLRAQSELKARLAEEERLKAQLQAQALVEERLRNESAAELKKQEARAAKMKMKLQKGEKERARLEYEKSRADAAKAKRLLKAKEEERLKVEHHLKIKEEERLRMEVQARAAAEKRQAMEMEALKIAERKEQIRLEMEQKEKARKEEELKIKAEEEKRKAEQEKLRLLELEAKAKEEEEAKKLAEEDKKKAEQEKHIAEHGVQVPDNIEGWKDIFKDWDNDNQKQLVKKIDLLSDNDIVKIMVWIVNDEAIRNDLTKFIMKWNKGNKFYKWYNENKRIIDVIRTYPGGLFTLCQIFKHDYVILYADSLRYWEPLLKIYDANRKLYDLPEITKTLEEMDGDPVAKYQKG